MQVTRVVSEERSLFFMQVVVVPKKEAEPGAGEKG